MGASCGDGASSVYTVMTPFQIDILLSLVCAPEGTRKGVVDMMKERSVPEEARKAYETEADQAVARRLIVRDSVGHRVLSKDIGGKYFLREATVTDRFINFAGNVARKFYLTD